MDKLKRALFFVSLTLALLVWLNAQALVGKAQGGSGEERRRSSTKSISPSKPEPSPKKLTTTKSRHASQSSFARRAQPSASHANYIRIARRAAEERAEREEYERRREAERIAESERAKREEVWHVAKIQNRTKGPIPFQRRSGCNGEWKSHVLQPGEGLIISSQANIVVRFDANYADGTQIKEYSLASSAVVGHEPTADEKQEAQANYFSLDSSNNIELYKQK